jgi:hypothetical protein
MGGSFELPLRWWQDKHWYSGESGQSNDVAIFPQYSQTKAEVTTIRVGPIQVSDSVADISKSTWNWYDQVELTNKTYYDASRFRITYYYLHTTSVWKNVWVC